MIRVRNIHNGELLQVIISHSRVNAILEEIIVRDNVSNILALLRTSVLERKMKCILYRSTHHLFPQEVTVVEIAMQLEFSHSHP